MTAVLYLRYSSDRQTEQSIEGQDRICTAFAEQNDYTIVRRYIDRATSAFKDTDKRTEFQRMIRDSEKQDFDTVIVYALDRFSRNRYDSATFKAKLKRNGVKVVSATEHISETPDGIILESVLEGMAEFYSKELSQKVTRGMHETALKCNSCGGTLPLGYKVVDKKYTIDEAKAEIVRTAFRMYADGSSVADICTHFTKANYRTSKGTEFNKNSFFTMFRNKKYIGYYTYKDVEIEGGIPAIVDRETFDAVQKRLKQNSLAPSRGKAKVLYHLSGKLVCGHCNTVMIGETGTGKSGKIYNYYTCPGRRREHTCNKKPITKEYIERIVVEDALSLLTDEGIEMIADAAVRACIEEAEKDDIIPALKAEIKELTNGINNIVKMIEKGADSEALITRLSSLEVQKKIAEQRLSEQEVELMVIDRTQVIYWLSQFKNGNIDDEDFRRQLIDLLIEKVTIWDEPDRSYRITSTYNLTQSASKTNTFSVLDGNGSPNTKQVHSTCFLFLYQ